MEHVLTMANLKLKPSLFTPFPGGGGGGMAKTLKIAKFLKNGPSFQEKSLKMGTLFCQNHP